MEVLLYTILTLCALGVFSAVILYFVARKFRVEEDPRIDEVEKKAARGGDRPLRRHVREASPHQRVQRGQVVCRGFVALCGRDGLRVRLSGLR